MEPDRISHNMEKYSMSGSMYIIHGTISTMYVTDGTDNLLEGMRGRMRAAGMGAVIDGMAGTVANSAMISMYDGESAQHFGCYVNEKMVIGTFEHVGFSEGEEVKMLVTDTDEKTLLAHAVVRVHDNLLWMPFSVSKGRGGIAKWIATLMFGLGSTGLAFFFLLDFFHSGFDSAVDFMAYLVPAMVLVGAGIGFLTYKSSVEDGIYAESIFRLLGFKSPWRVNISPYSQARLRGGGSYQVYELQPALRAHDLPV